MTKDLIIRCADFDPRVRTYWLVSGIFLCIITVAGIPLLLLWIPLGLFFTGRYLKRMECVLTSKALKVKKGIMVRVEKTIPLEKITDMAMVQGPLMRQFDIFKLTVETAGQSGQGALVSLVGIVGAKAFREAVLAQRDTVSGMAGSRSSGDAPGHADADSGSLAEIKDSLLRIEGLLSEIAGNKKP
ncbi:MAG: PH domain-containing protein [Xanthomonadales bacterium]|nr:PH domain-containing protein [Gammaproteobacteria bacterium]NNE06312.1 PH domain-containing protein [Xanthomonadales bacterium]NNL93990.1 PH domain-containing protein [Xanthomonadales bacterium]